MVSLRLDDTERSRLYREGLNALQESESLPTVFREIFKDAVVPFGDHRTLALFLNTMDRMQYDDSEKLGDAYEYLLKIADAQADAGQFRTPRHIINFIVSVINPQKHEVIIDPACGTAGFLVSAYQHIKNQNRGPNGETTLSAPDLNRLASNLKGYDISPEMTKLAMANMYLHTQDKDPNIDNYDTLTSTDHWNEFADVMLANPPFMTPKGGIKPHGLFRVKATRAEVLFVDYIATHLNEHGRAGIIVPEGVIFQSQTAYKQLRKLLVEESLVAVISLPAGVFQPYSGVKTSILILDRVLAPKTDSIGFFKVENDGYDLGAQRRPIDKDDLPAVAVEIGEFLRRIRAGESLDDLNLQSGALATKEHVANDGDCNLSGERYRVAETAASKYAMLPFSEVCTLEYGSSLPKRDRITGPYPVVGSNGITGYHNEYLVEGPAIIVGRKGSAGEVSLIMDNCFPIDTTYFVKLVNPESADINYLSYLLRTLDLPSMKDGAGVPGLNRNDVYQKYQLPLPPLVVQQSVVAEVESYQRVIDGARAVVDNWRPRIAVDPEWPLAGISDLVADTPNGFKAGPFGSSLKKDCYVPSGYKVYGQEQVIRGDANFGDYYIDDEKYRELEKCKVQAGDVLVSLVGTYGKTMIVPEEHEPGIINPRLVKITLDRQKMTPEFLVNVFTQEQTVAQMQSVSHGGTMSILGMQTLKRLQIPVPPVETQQAIVAGIEEEQALVSANRELIERMEQRIQATIARVWES